MGRQRGAYDSMMYAETMNIYVLMSYIPGSDNQIRVIGNVCSNKENSVGAGEGGGGAGDSMIYTETMSMSIYGLMS